MDKVILLVIGILIISNVLALCEENQIDINSASKQELTEITYIGEVRAGQIVEMRPFNSVDDLIDIKGIGEITLQKIKDQELACVSDEIAPSNFEEKEENISKEENGNAKSDKELKYEELQNDVDSEEEFVKNSPNVISLTPKTIKSEENLKLNKSDYALYGFFGFCIFIVILFLIRKKDYKTEFDK